MSRKVVIKVIAKALADEEFRGRLLSSPDAVLSDYDLAAAERKSLSALQDSALRALAAEIEERISRVTPPPIPESMHAFWKEGLFQMELTPLDIDHLLGREGGQAPPPGGASGKAGR